MSKTRFYSVTVALIVSLLVLSLAACSQPAPAGETKPAPTGETKPAETRAPATAAPKPTAAPESKAAPAEAKPASGEIKVGFILPYTGVAAASGKEMERGHLYYLDKFPQMVGKKVVSIREDETDDPTIAIAKAKKLVEQDKVDVIVGTLLAHTAAAVEGYLAPLGVPHLALGWAEKPESKHTFYTIGTGRGNTFHTGVFAAEELKAKTAALLAMDYAMGVQCTDGFTAGFESKGGKVISKQRIPMGTADTAPFLEGIKDADVVGVFLTQPTDLAFVRQYSEAGLKKPVIFISTGPQEEPILAQMGDNVLGMYGGGLYGLFEDRPEAKQFVDEYKAKTGVYPTGTAYSNYLTMAILGEAVKATGGDTDKTKLTQALLNIKDLKLPGGSVSITAGRMGSNEGRATKVVKSGSRYYFDTVKIYPKVEPR